MLPRPARRELATDAARLAAVLALASLAAFLIAAAGT
jgi:hypothetical protein